MSRVISWTQIGSVRLSRFRFRFRILGFQKYIRSSSSIAIELVTKTRQQSGKMSAVDLAPGAWILNHADNVDGYLKAIGVNIWKRKMTKNMTSTQTISINDNGTWNIVTNERPKIVPKSLSKYNNSETYFELGIEFDEIDPNGKEVKSIASVQGNKLIIEQKRASVTSTIVRTFNVGQMVMTMEAKGVTCTLAYFMTVTSQTPLAKTALAMVSGSREEYVGHATKIGETSTAAATGATSAAPSTAPPSLKDKDKGEAPGKSANLPATTEGSEAMTASEGNNILTGTTLPIEEGFTTESLMSRRSSDGNSVSSAVDSENRSSRASKSSKKSSKRSP